LGIRQQMSADALGIFRDYPSTGVGLGAHEVVFPAYESQLNETVAEHVENEYIEAAEETGVAGLLCIVGFIAVVLWHLLRAVRSRETDTSMIAIGLAFALIAVAVHSLSDYGQHIPAVAGISAAMCGLIIALTPPKRTFAMA